MLLIGEAQVGDHDVVTERVDALLILHGSREACLSSAYDVSPLTFDILCFSQQMQRSKNLSVRSFIYYDFFQF